jgi:hypothetical protein
MLIKKWKIKKLWLILILSVFLLALGFYFLNNRPIDWEQPFEIFKSATPESLSKYPTIDDCRNKNQVSFDDSEPSVAELDAIIKKATLLQQFSLREGYSLGRIRMEKIGIPNGDVCFKYFYLGIKNNETSAILEGEDQLQAFIVKDDQLPIIGQLLYGEPNKVDYKKKYFEWITKKPCVSSSDRDDCVSYRLAFPPLIKDGQITQDLRGVKTLHRFIFEGMADYAIVHKKITVDSNKIAHVESQKLIQHRTGIMF